MARIIIDDLRSGMVLAEDVTNRNGNVLLKAGCHLSDKHVKAMKMWGVTDVSVADDAAMAGDGPESVDPQALEQVKASLRQRFRHGSLDHPAAAELFEQTALRLAQRQARG